MDNFDLKKYLGENKLTPKNKIEEQSSGIYWSFFTGKSFDGANAYTINKSNNAVGSEGLEDDIKEAFYETFVLPWNEDFEDNEEDIIFFTDVEFGGYGGKAVYRGELELELENDEVEFIVFY